MTPVHTLALSPVLALPWDVNEMNGDIHEPTTDPELTHEDHVDAVLLWLLEILVFLRRGWLIPGYWGQILVEWGWQRCGGWVEGREYCGP